MQLGDLLKEKQTHKVEGAPGEKLFVDELKFIYAKKCLRVVEIP